jgi:tetratricopeptide (TPR) repeat protein
VAPDARHVVLVGESRPWELLVLRLWGRDGSDKLLEQVAAVLERNPQDARALEQRAQAFLRRGQPERALADLNAAIAHRPSKEAHFLRALAHLRNEHLRNEHRAAALSDLAEAIRLDPRDAQAHYQRGLLLMEKKDYRGARRSLDEAFRLDPRLARAADLEVQENEP